MTDGTFVSPFAVEDPEALAATERVQAELARTTGRLVDAVVRTRVDDATLAAADLSVLRDTAQLAVAKKLAEWPRLVEIAGRTNEPHRVAFYLYDLASDLHSLWNRGNDETTLRFVQDGDIAATSAKIALARAVGVVISAGLGILGVTPAKEMR